MSQCNGAAVFAPCAVGQVQAAIQEAAKDKASAVGQVLKDQGPEMAKESSGAEQKRRQCTGCRQPVATSTSKSSSESDELIR